MRFFCYGTLMDRDLAALVMRRQLAARALRPARLVGWRRSAACGLPYPIVLPCRGAAVSGCVIERVSAAERRRLCAYEGEGYALRRGIAVRDGQPMPVYFFAPRAQVLAAAAGAWSLARWRRAAKSAALAAVESQSQPFSSIRQISVLAHRPIF